MSLAFMSAVRVDLLLGRLDLVPSTQVSEVRQVILSFGFRSCQNMIDQVMALERETSLALRSIAILFEVKYTTLRDMVKVAKSSGTSQTSPEVHTNQRIGPHGALLVQEEERLLGWIRRRQADSSCPTAKDVRMGATRILHERDKGAPDLTSYWRRSFKKRHSGVVATKVVHSIESGRVDVSSCDVLRYFGEILDPFLASKVRNRS